MPVNLSVKDVPDELAQALRERAARNHRSLQGELMSILSQTIQAESTAAAVPPAVPAVVRESAPLPTFTRSRMHGWKTVEQIAAERRAQGWTAHPSMATAPKAVDLIRADRDSR